MFATHRRAGSGVQPVDSGAVRPAHGRSDEHRRSPGEQSEGVPHELLAAWLQFLKADLTEAVNALNNRLNVINALTRMDDRNLTSEQRSKLEQIRIEVDRSARITTGLLRRVSSVAPNTKPPVFDEYDGVPERPAHILLVEDDASNRVVIAKLFERLGHRVLPVTNGLDAYDALRHEQIDCVVCDLRLPYTGGRTLFEQIERDMPHIASRFVFVTGDYTDPESRLFLEQTGQPFIGKPYEVEVLLGAVAKTLQQVGVLHRR